MILTLKQSLAASVFLLQAALLPAQQQTLDLSDNEWSIWLDETATWIDDSLYLLPPPIAQLPNNPPTCGWEQLWDGRGKRISLPATVEEHFWGNNGHPFGVAGNYKGVSWFFSKLSIPVFSSGETVALRFESVRLRAEIYLDGRLVGYDLINGTAFEIDITPWAHSGRTHDLAIRITDPSGNFEWMDLAPHTWGKHDIPPSHGFGGITGKVFLEIRPPMFVEDVFIRNKPIPHSIDAEITLNGTPSKNGNLLLELVDTKAPYRILLAKKIKATTPVVRATLTLPGARLWDPGDPNLYLLKVTYRAGSGQTHVLEKRFGFRWFEVREAGGDKQFWLNGKRIVLRTSISWGFWPINGITPTYELAKKQILAAKALGLNCLNFHRHMGQTMVLDLADELGLLYYAEPGGYKTGIASKFTADWNRERMVRMIRSFRSHPSLIMYNMINESTRNPQLHEYEDIRLFHRLDNTRCITFTSTNFTDRFYPNALEEGIEKPVKMHMLPYDTTVWFKGWWDMHFADGPGVYKDEFYQSPQEYLRNTSNFGEIVFWGEDGAIGTPERLQLNVESYTNAKNLGWDGDTYLAQYRAFDQFLKAKGFSSAFPDVDSLCRSLGNNALYYQGRIIENIRINNATDGYVVNGWEGSKIENHSGIVDVWRNPKGDPAIMAHYNQPLFIAIKARNTVLQTGDSTFADLFIVNEKNISGAYQLYLTASLGKEQVWSRTYEVNISGGNQYGELLVDSIPVTVPTAGYLTLTAVLKQGANPIASGLERVFATDLPLEKLTQPVFVSDTSGVIQHMMRLCGIPYSEQKGPFNPVNGILLLDGNNAAFLRDNWRVNNEFIEWVSDGNTAICLGNCDVFADFLERKEVVDYYGKQDIGKVWYGGNYFNRSHPVFDGLPQNTAFNWEWQRLAGYNLKRYGLRLEGDIVLAGVYSDHRREMYSALSIIPVGRGNIILSTFDLHGGIQPQKPSSAVAKRLLLNYLLFAQQENLPR
ncbi:MAG: hypothetical protein KBG02_00075 [Haliscomenobacter sp.]|nr:beta-glycosidase [Haliscomenobacter sp.]MBK8652484.1 beta-glycosidase [Haliscomenobacter sp.]MBP9075225.1 hypothetical protein [Haliscomenobacter sp.]MBP9872398.1 hypothetical protein [Haliscomenobacter sp.]